MQITKRPATEADKEFSRLAHHRAYQAVVIQQFGSWSGKMQDEFFNNDWSGANYEIILCDEKPCGYLCLENREADIHIRELVIVPAYQGRGVGTHILQSAIEQAKTRQVPVRLGTFHSNKAVELYRKLGFREFGKTETHILMEWKAD